jgi:hypothetical protein
VGGLMATGTVEPSLAAPRASAAPSHEAGKIDTTASVEVTDEPAAVKVVCAVLEDVHGNSDSISEGSIPEIDSGPSSDSE